MPSFDIENTIVLQEVDNAVNNTKKELQTRYDFKNTPTEITLHKNEKVISCSTGDELKLKSLIEMFLVHCSKRGISTKSIEYGAIEPTSKGAVKQTLSLKEGIARDVAGKITKAIKETKLKVQTAIQDDKIRVTGKKIDDLQEVIALVKSMDLDIPVQFVNMKS